jgi:hypothetical protein
MLFGEFALATEILECALQLFCEVFKHRKEFSVNSGPSTVSETCVIELVGWWQLAFILGWEG